MAVLAPAITSTFQPIERIGGIEKKYKKEEKKVLGAELCLLKRHVEVLTPSIYQCDLSREWGFCKRNRDELLWVPVQHNQCPHKKEDRQI